eukprot:TRINITY_DN2851_c1_g1_i1.p1 TRINITY_DN2851_c1_g1~~TRINITY_DN2851_c1_g1_i1.p1  ORF type:complete len:383 (+),score=88.46 TRINITY_DN2851_c1_g1_i1:115-1149(+)
MLGAPRPRPLTAVAALAALATAVSGLVLQPKSEGSAAPEARNLCIGGRLAPELLLLGAARASTSLFAQNVHLSSGIFFPYCQEDEIKDGRRSFCPAAGVKELHIFNHAERVALGRDDWLRHYPRCNASDSRSVATDMTPGYLADEEAPGRMKLFYGNHIRDVTFLVFLRDPVKCMQSFFYYEHQDKKETFQAWAENALATSGKRNRHFRNAIYAEDLARYLSTFSPSQFIIVPMKYNVVGGKDGEPEVTDYVWSSLQVPGPPPGISLKEQWNYYPHPALEEDLDKPTLQRLSDLAASLTGPEVLAGVLAKAAKASGDGGAPRLFGYEGDATDEKAIAQWLADGW